MLPPCPENYVLYEPYGIALITLLLIAWVLGSQWSRQRYYV